jgi:hypothetical protein
MGIIRSFLAFVVVILITTTLLAGNAVVAVDRTAANEEFVTTTLEEEDAYGTVQSAAGDEVADQVAETDLPVDVDARRVINDTLTRSYLRNQTEANVNRAFRYLEDDTDELNLSVNLAPLKTNVATAIEDRIREQSVGELIDVIAENEESLSTEVAGVGIDLRIVANMSEDRESYQAARESFRADIRTAAIERLANESYQESVDNEEYDPLLALVIDDYDPSEYSQGEKATLAEEREDEIKAELRNEIQAERGDDIDAEVDEQLGNINEEVSATVADAVESSLEGGQYEPVSEPATEMLVVGVEGLTTNKSYEEFDAELTTAKNDLAANVSVIVRNRLDDEVDDRFDLLRNDEISEQDRAEIQRAAADTKDGYGGFQLLVLAFPLAVLVLIGLLFLLTRSVSTTALLSGVPMALVGGLTYGVAAISPDGIESQVEPELRANSVPENVIDLLLGIVEQTLAVVAGQSLMLALLGVGLIIAGVVLRTRGS